MTRILVFLTASVLLAGCGGGQKKVPEADVKGTVKFDGKPLEDGEIVFITPGTPGDKMDIKGGAFAGRAKVGEDRIVQVYSWKEGVGKDPMTGEMVKNKINIVAELFNTKSRLKATVKDGDNTFHFEVASQ